ncbi:osmotically inducible protein OsmC [Sphingobacteriaceae bacterium]|nr:osmotically inducible protein OsmC [Sphingobacteriaceae bacterium]
METKHFYEIDVDWVTDRKGLMNSPVLKHNLEVATPPEFPKGMEGIWSPEHLFVAAVNSCLMTTFLSIAENSKLEFQSFRSKAIGKLELIDDKYMMSEITLMPVLTIDDEIQKEKANRVLQKSEANCLISNSVKSKIIFKPEVKITSIS